MTHPFADQIGPWHDWFAWFPVRTYDGKWVWLRTVRRCRAQTHAYLSGPIQQWWVYHA